MEYIQKNFPLKHVFYGPFTSKEEVDKAEFAPLYQDFDVVPVIVTGEGKNPDGHLHDVCSQKAGP